MPKKKYMKLHKTILEKTFLDSWFEEYKDKNKLASIDAARQDYYSKKHQLMMKIVQKF